MSAIVDRTKVLRSKNAGPFVITLDVIFGSRDDFEAIKRSLTPDLLAAAYSLPSSAIVGIDFVPELNAMKASFRRRRPCGHPGDPDCYGMNQEQPLARLLGELVRG